MGSYFTINECQLVYFLYISKSLLLFCSYLKIYSFKCAAFKYKRLRGRAVKSRKSPCVMQGVQGSILSDVIFFFLSFFSHVSLKMLVYILLQALRLI